MAVHHSSPHENPRLFRVALLIFLLVLALFIVSTLTTPTRDRRAVRELEQTVARELAARYTAPQELHALSGVVRGVYGATIQLEVEDPEDYLPHADGTPRRRVVRFATVTPRTNIVRFSEVTLGENTHAGANSDALPLSAVKPGMLVRVLSDENLVTTPRFLASEVRIIE
jgi:hypothetical protein